MTKEEALKMLDAAPKSHKPSKVNRSISIAQGVQIIKDYIVTLEPGEVLKDLMEKRVYQVCRDQRRPKY
jgi:hypothetical protein